MRLLTDLDLGHILPQPYLLNPCALEALPYWELNAFCQTYIFLLKGTLSHDFPLSLMTML